MSYDLTPSKYGLIFDPVHAQAMAKTSDMPVFSLAAPKLMDSEPREVFFPRFLAKACLEKYGSDWRYRSQYQKRGTCGGQGSKTTVDFALAVRRYLYGEAFPGRSAVCGNYAGSRVEVGNYVAAGDGTASSWVATWLVRWGTVILDKIGLDPNYYEVEGMDADEQLAIEWAQQQSGVPAEVEDSAKELPFTKAILIQTVDELLAAQSALNTVMLASDLIPVPTRDRNGISRVQKEGGHLTACAGQIKMGSSWVFPYVQSWGNQWARGTWPLDNPLDNMFAGCVTFIREGDMQKMLSQRQTYALVHPEGLAPLDGDYSL